LRKIVYILLILVLSASCSVSRKQKRGGKESIRSSRTDYLFDNILNQNLTARSFFIEKAEFVIKSGNEEKSGLGTVKFLLPDKFLITIKSHAGIEVARIYFTGDSIMINDRFGKKTYYASASFLKSKYGITTAVLPVILGDYVNDVRLDSSNMKCSEGILEVDALVKSLSIKYKISCDNGKSIETIPEPDFNDNGIDIKYGDFFKVNNMNAPGIITISDSQNNTVIEIRIQKITIPWEGTIDFIPGKQYEKIHLL
jgi:hypothetical protein